MLQPGCCIKRNTHILAGFKLASTTTWRLCIFSSGTCSRSPLTICKAIGGTTAYELKSMLTCTASAAVLH